MIPSKERYNTEKHAITVSTHWIMKRITWLTMRHHGDGQMSLFKQEVLLLAEGHYVSHFSSDVQCSQG